MQWSRQLDEEFSEFLEDYSQWEPAIERIVSVDDRLARIEAELFYGEQEKGETMIAFENSTKPVTWGELVNYLAEMHHSQKVAQAKQSGDVNGTAEALSKLRNSPGHVEGN